MHLHTGPNNDWSTRSMPHHRCHVVSAPIVQHTEIGKEASEVSFNHLVASICGLHTTRVHAIHEAVEVHNIAVAHCGRAHHAQCFTGNRAKLAHPTQIQKIHAQQLDVLFDPMGRNLGRAKLSGS
eukprot:TRINITY_DN3189_c0_g3_i5.p2 TRINITY_DN3189_c0_g3~~TRINITY_DN3189_c0_g3_i5.p2  ORF type:complete len:125 (+),score=17.44 TRINITY_DN3189_c0_g3_i5:213-587(+)